ncbi:MAG: hypothetical protein KGJ89_03460 [Patescibacteria group bacterium]|nr:hypothetical protein [Patescibacteria group bacterium]MDE2015396.1 hypothetical protein [Patescibacteria group bacterium]MDE2226989.1 hypothetical protein [Patescibacteria group bacterium]
MYLWFLIIGTFIPQEFLSTGAVLLLARQTNFPIIFIHLIWFGATFIDMYVGYILGNLLRNSMSHTALVERVNKWSEALKSRLGEHGEKLSLFILGFMNFPYLNTFLASWLKIPMTTAFAFTFLGNFLWYVILWATVFGAAVLVPSQRMVLFIVIIAGVVSSFFFKFFSRYFRKKRAKK